MKKKTAILVSGLLALALLAGCGKEKNTDGGEDNGSAGGENGYVTLGDYGNMEISIANPEVTDAEVQAYIENILASYPAYETTDKTLVESGDTVDIDYEGLKDGVAFEGGTAQGHKLVIGSNSFIEGFEEGLIGANVGDTLELNLTFPDPYINNPDMAGQPVVFNVTINGIVQAKEMTYDALTDEYVSTSLGYDTVQALKDGIKEQIASTNEYYAESNKRSAIISKLQEISTINSLPEGLLDERVASYKEQFAAMCSEQYGLEMADYLEQYYQTTEEDFNTQVVEYMQENIELELILLAIGEKEGIELDEEGYGDYVTSMVSNYGYESQEELFAEYGEDYIKDSYLCNKVMEMLLETVKVTYTNADDTAGGTEGTQGGQEADGDTDTEE